MTRLGFDLIHGLMTVDYETSVIDHEGLVRRVRERAGMQADLAGQPETASPALTSWWSRHGRWVSTVSSGLALGIGLAAAWLGPLLDLEKGSGQRLAQGCFALAVCCGGAWLVPRAVRSLRRSPARYRRAHGTGDPGGARAGAMGRGGDRGLPVRPLRVARVSEPGACPPGDPQPAGDRAPDR